MISVPGLRKGVVLSHNSSAEHAAVYVGCGDGRVFQPHQNLSPTRRMTCGGGGGAGGSACGSGSCMKVRSMWVHLPLTYALVLVAVLLRPVVEWMWVPG